MHDVLRRFETLGVIPVVALERAEDAMPLADALIEGGLPCAEITFRTMEAAEAMRTMAQREDILVGAGTVLTVDQVKTAHDSGARFIVTPGFNPKVVSYCVANKITIIPGVCTPSDIEGALEFDLEVLKFFPAEAFGGLTTLKALSGPYAAVKFVPTSGINPVNLPEYLSFPNVLACGGTWLAKSPLIAEGGFGQIAENVRNAVKIVAGCRKLEP